VPEVGGRSSLATGDARPLARAVLLSILVRSIPVPKLLLLGTPGPGVAGTLSKVYSLGTSTAGLDSGAPTLLYGRSGWREYGNMGSTAVTLRADPALQADITIYDRVRLLQPGGTKQSGHQGGGSYLLIHSSMK
jgi:hypothetical protein